MAEVLPQIKVTDPQDGPSLDDSPTSSSVTDNLDVTKDARFASGGSIEGKVGYVSAGSEVANIVDFVQSDQ